MPTSPPTDRLPKTYLAAAEVIDLLRLDVKADGTQSKATGIRRLRNLRDTGRLPFVKIGKQFAVYPRADVQRYIKNNLVEAQ